MSESQKVLIVDDEPRNLRIILETLDGFAEAKVASSGEEALKVVDEFLPDLVLLDIMMPGIDGYEVCKKIKSHPGLNLTKVILVSGKAMLNERLKGYEAGADDYMTKPFAPEELHAKAKVFLRLARVEKELEELNQSLEKKVEERTQQLLEAESKLINSAKMAALGEMAGGIAHEVNTPLGTIGLLGDQIEELVTEDPIDRTTIIGMTQGISETVRRITSIVQGLRTFSRDASNDRFDSIAIKRIIDDTLTLCQEKIKYGNIRMQIGNIPPDLVLSCRPVQISQVLVNVINNACDAILPLSERWIKIDAEKKDNFIELSVTDSGSGISEEVRNKIFQPFFTTKEIGKGTGLGLSISQGILKAHHGTLDIDPNCRNTRFVLRFLSNLEVSLQKSA